MSNSSLNLYKSFTYAQPETYHFSHDSVFLARNVFDAVRAENLPADKILDLCSGCGIVGLDYAFHMAKELGRKSAIDFVEVQNVYEPFLNENIHTLNSLFPGMLTSNCVFENYENLHLSPAMKAQYDLILCNPPYFRPGQGKLSPSDFKNRCRFFIDSGFKELMEAISFLLKPGGSAFILLQSLEDHNIDIMSELESYQLFTVQKRGLIRATGFYQLIKPF
ncbi:MAG: methyltransferase [Pseudobdellovibrio sp.]|jgi:tRNA1(Val) A37 N6-methylase TrmN6|nr:methyltransferase [Pseudobdellovibrio sp.]